MSCDVIQISDKYIFWGVSFLFVQDDDEMYDEMFYVLLLWSSDK